MSMTGGSNSNSSSNAPASAPSAATVETVEGPLPLATTVTAATLSRLDIERARYAQAARDAFAAETVRAEPVDTSNDIQVEYHYSLVSRQCLIKYSIRSLLCVVTMVVIVGTTLVTLEAQTQSSKSPPPETVTRVNATVTASPTLAPVFLEDGREAFTSTRQLYAAVDSYMDIEADDNPASSLATSDVAVRYGYPLNVWDVSRLTDLSRVFDPDREQYLDVDRRPDLARVLSATQNLSGWDTSRVTTLKGIFAGSVAFLGIGVDTWTVDRVTDFSFAFMGAHEFIGNVTTWNTSSASTMASMFQEAKAFDNTLSLWDVSRVTNMNSMFGSAKSFRGNGLSDWNVSNVVDMNALFSGAETFQGNVSAWDTSRVVEMSFTFYNARSFHGDVSRWNVGNVETMDSMFMEAPAFVGEGLSGWNTSRVKSMAFAFNRASKFRGDISTWDVSRVTMFAGMFEKTAFNGDLSLWDTGSAQFMDAMFYDNHVFSGDLSMWNTSKLTSASNMFWVASSFNSDLSRWDVSNLIHMEAMFREAKMFNHSLCQWSERLPLDVSVKDMFNDTACNDTGAPSKRDDGTKLEGPFCTVCEI